ncbi:TIGR03364 family FAD-dependent oxidoreductase [Thiopseudomonas alkaliphila]|uniref:TIGR03364 family FAD-dependent oxidoreductase n=1 Tax=Thiopseudomonas alkaliphila TaxID=1697053 RepID=UPI002576DEE9|nr:TIGR03364 family FAD-dependent oxidoreductase [Thiopseudomonas alkaliphila]MDM1708874.1 TIGR03364 family FAD-dependent oxidoreductase [Thiopseudomonas alkaliphila]
MKFDVAVVGAGVIGLAHAYAAAQRGLKVVIFERSYTPFGASVRNFGHGLVLGQTPGRMLDLAKASRGIWGDLAIKANFLIRKKGSYVIARTPAEQAVIEAFAEGRAKEYGYDCELLNKQQLAGIYGGRLQHHRAALHGKEDQVLFSREAIPQVAAYLASLENVCLHFSTLVRDIDSENGKLITTNGEFSAEQIFVCSGHDYQTLLADEIKKLQPVVCRLQMLRVRTAQDFGLEHALLTGLSCTHYGAFADLPEAAALAAEIKAQTPLLDEHGIHLLITPTPYGDLIIGDSHEYSVDAQPFNSEQVDQLLIDLAEDTLGCAVQIKERWQGVYGAKGAEPISILKPTEKVTAVLMRAGLGMSVGPGLGEQNISQLFD